MLQSERTPSFYTTLGAKLARIIESEEKNVKIIASSDFSHFIPEADAKEADQAPKH